MKLYNTLSRKIEDFVPIEENVAKIYTCGPTVYDYAHIGNLRTYIHEDILVKSLRYLGFEVRRAMNITDVGHLESDDDFGEDKMIAGARRENKTVWEIAEMYTEKFFENIKDLNIEIPEIIEKATDHIKNYIDFIQELEKKGYTYFAGGNVYFDVAKFPDYNKLSRMPLEELKSGHREDVELDINKKNPLDFVLWFTKSKFENQAMKWDSPWGVGYPGWHIECSVIAMETLGDKLDIHCGGVDHITVHHTNEIAQAEAYLDEQWCNYWWHAEFLIETTGKMSKSKGDFLTLDLLKEKSYNPIAYRYYVLNSHYRKQLSFSYDRLDEAQNAYIKLRKRCTEIIKSSNKALVDSSKMSQEAMEFKKQFENFLKQDLNTANSITVLYEMLKSSISDKEKYTLLADFDIVLSLDLIDEYEEKLEVNLTQEEIKNIQNLIDKRTNAKLEKNWALADKIRDELLGKNINLIDTKDGTNWEVRSDI